MDFSGLLDTPLGKGTFTDRTLVLTNCRSDALSLNEKMFELILTNKPPGFMNRNRIETLRALILCL